MIPTHCRGIPKHYPKPKSTQERGEIKKLSLFDWIARFSFTSTSIVAEIWGVDPSVVNRALRRYVNEGYLTEVPITCCRDKRLFILKPKAIKYINDYHLTPIKYNMKRSNLPLKTINHDLVVQLFLAINITSNKFFYFITEKEQEKDNKGKNRRVDAIVFDIELGEMIAIEVECSSKNIPHRVDLLKKYQKALFDDELYSRVVFVSFKRRHLRDCERVNNKILTKDEGVFFKTEPLSSSLKYLYNKQVMSILYHKIWDF